ncbi:galactosyldiacylglycerol synthase [Actinomycetes bacterium NPDC127524]
MKKILIMPLLRLPSGHHQVAEAVANMIQQQKKDVEIKKIDFISYTSGILEAIVTNLYLKWIRYTPGSYQWVYGKYVNADSKETALLKFYKHLFMKKMNQLVAEEKPDLIICTHGFPSLLLSQLKADGKISIPVVNVYTDFFMNDMWGKEAIDAHFVPNKQVQLSLMNKFKVPKKNIFITGIPVHSEFLLKKKDGLQRGGENRKKVLISGGNSGLGDIINLLQDVKDARDFDYRVLCGNNQKLLKQIQSWNLPHITPISYITSRSAMNNLYNEADAIITKPGGVTISEVIRKNIPIFIHSALPGQEEVNLKFLKDRGLAFEFMPDQPIESQLAKVIGNDKKMSIFNKHLAAYNKELNVKEKDIASLIESLLENHAYKEMRQARNDSFYVSTSY